MAVLSGLGRAIMRRLLKIQNLNGFEDAFFSYALGLGVFGSAVLLLGLFNLLQAPVILSMSALFIAIAIIFNRDIVTRRDSRNDPPAPLLAFVGWSFPFAALLSLILLLQGFYALAPEIFYDSLIYHLGLPNLYRMEGGIIPTPSNMYSGIPMLFQMVYTGVLFLGDETLAELIHWSTGIGIVAGMLGFGARCRKPLLGWIAAAIFFSTPLVGDNIMRAGVEVGISYWLFSSIYALALCWFVKGSPDEKPFWLLSSVLSGFVLAAKYTPWPYMVGLLVCFILLRISKREISFYFGVAGSFALPWILKNVLFYRNPIYPFMHESFNPDASYPVLWRALHQDGWGRNWGAILRDGRQLFEVVVHPWFMTVRGMTDFDHVGPIFLLALPGICALRASSKEGKIFLWALFALWATWWPLTGMPRFFMPGLALLSVLVAYFFLTITTAWARNGMLAGLVLLCLNGFSVFAQFSSRFDSWPYLLGKQSKAEYLRHHHLTYINPSYMAIDWINNNTPPEAHVLLLGDGRGYYLARSFIASSPLDTPFFFHLLNISSSSDDLRGRLGEAGITHLLLNMALLARSHPPLDSDGSRYRILTDLFEKNMALRFEDRDYADERWSLVYELTPDRPPEHHSSPLLTWYARKK